MIPIVQPTAFAPYGRCVVCSVKLVGEDVTPQRAYLIEYDLSDGSYCNIVFCKGCRDKDLSSPQLLLDIASKMYSEWEWELQNSTEFSEEQKTNYRQKYYTLTVTGRKQ